MASCLTWIKGNTLFRFVKRFDESIVNSFACEAQHGARRGREVTVGALMGAVVAYGLAKGAAGKGRAYAIGENYR